MNIAVIGSGGREHAISWKLAQNSEVNKIYTLPGNAATPNNIPIKVTEFARIKQFCLENEIELIYVGPEQPLTEGIVDYFADTDIKVFGPDKRASQLESSKVFAKQFMEKYNVATASYKSFCDSQQAMEFIRTLQNGCVIKYDGLAGGKGVFVCQTKEEAEQALEKLTDKYGADASLLVEELLTGKELSVLAFTDGKTCKLMIPSQDHKQLYNGDKGPNTGGMGAFCPVDFCTPELMQQIRESIVDPSIEGLSKENFCYKGVLYFGLMLTDDGPKVLEYNVRLGDPETEVVLPALKSDLLQLVLSCFDGTLQNYKVEFEQGYFVDVVLTSGGYPHEYAKGYPIKINMDKDFLLFHAGTKMENDNLLTAGGRVLNVIGKGSSLQDAIDNAYHNVKQVTFKDMYFRTDIGNREK